MAKVESFPVLLVATRTLLDVQVDESRLRERWNEAQAILDPVQTRAVHRGIRALESRWLGFFTTAVPERFTRAPAERRQRRLRSLARSRVPALRVLYVALHRLCAGLHYGDPQEHREGFYPGPPALEPRDGGVT